MDAVASLAIQDFELGVFRRLAAQAAAGDDRGLVAECWSEFDAGIAHRLARGHQCELREAVQQIQPCRFEMFRGRESGNLGSVRKTKQPRIHRGQRPDAGTAAQDLAPAISHVLSERANHAQATYGDAAAGDGVGGQRRNQSEVAAGAGPGAESERSIASTICRTVRSERTTSSGSVR